MYEFLIIAMILLPPYVILNLWIDEKVNRHFGIPPPPSRRGYQPQFRKSTGA